MIPLLLKARIIASRHGREVTIALAVLGIVSLGAAGWAAAYPGTSEVTETRNEQTFNADLGSRAVVTGDTSVWETGTTLQDKHVYLLSATPNVELQPTATVPANESVEVTQRVTLVYEVERNGRTVWRSEELLFADSTRVEDGKVVSNATLNTTHVRNRVSEIENEFGGVGTVSTHLRTDVTYRTDQYEGQVNATGPITFTDRAIAIDNYPSAERTHAQTVTVTEQSARSWPLIGALAVLGALSLFGAWWVVENGPELVDVPAAEKRLERARYETWISAGTIPDGIGENAVQMESLDSLVNLAIDSSKRVIFDEQTSKYGVVDGNTLYYYTETDREEPPLFDDLFEPIEDVDESTPPSAGETAANGNGDTEHADDETEDVFVIDAVGNND